MEVRSKDTDAKPYESEIGSVIRILDLETGHSFRCFVTI